MPSGNFVTNHRAAEVGSGDSGNSGITRTHFVSSREGVTPPKQWRHEYLRIIWRPPIRVESKGENAFLCIYCSKQIFIFTVIAEMNYVFLMEHFFVILSLYVAFNTEFFGWKVRCSSAHRFSHSTPDGVHGNICGNWERRVSSQHVSKRSKLAYTYFSQ